MTRRDGVPHSVPVTEPSQNRALSKLYTGLARTSCTSWHQGEVTTGRGVVQIPRHVTQSLPLSQVGKSIGSRATLCRRVWATKTCLHRNCRTDRPLLPDTSHCAALSPYRPAGSRRTQEKPQPPMCGTRRHDATGTTYGLAVFSRFLPTKVRPAALWVLM